MLRLNLFRASRKSIRGLIGLVPRRWINFRRRYLSFPLWKAKRRLQRLRHGPDRAPLVSVIIPAHNAAATLSETVESLRVQRLASWEAIIVDDGSTDSTASVITALQQRDRRVRGVRQAQMGVSHARNAGLLHAVADRVMFLDADDWIAPDYFEQMFAALAENPSADAVYCGYCCVSPEGRRLPMTYSPEIARAPFATFAHHCAAAIHCLLLRRQLVAEVGGFDANLRACEDWDLWLRIARSGASFVGVPLPLAFYRLRPGSASRDYARMITDAYHVIVRSRSADLRVRRADPRYIDGVRADDVVEQWAYFAIWCAGVEAANGRSGLPAFDLLGRLPDFKGSAVPVAECLSYGMSIGGRCPPSALAEIWHAAEASLVEISERLESASTWTGLGRCIMENLETRVLRECELSTPRALWRMCGYRIDVGRPPPDIEPAPHVDNVYLRVTDGEVLLDEIHLPVLGPIASADVARLILDAWGLDHTPGRGFMPMRLKLAFRIGSKVAKGSLSLFRRRQGRLRQIRDILLLLWRGFRAGALLRAATAPRPVRVAEEHHHRAAVLVNRWRDEVSHSNGAARRACVAAGRSSAADAFEAPKSADRRAMWNGKPDARDRQRASAYEQKKNEHTLAVLPDEPIGRAMEMACAEGHLTERLAPRVVSLLAIDGCGQSLGRARTRCKNHANVEFQSLDLAGDAIPGGMELIVCSDALYSVKDAAELHRIAKKLASALAPGGRIVATHAFVLGDDPQRSAFDWDCPFGATTIDGVFSETPGLEKERSLVTELYRVDLYRRPIGGAPKADPEIAHVELDSPLDPEVERQIVWGGATLRRSGARISEVTERVPILMYHQVSGAGAPSRERYRVDPRAFEQQLRFLRQHGYHSISAAEFLEAIRIGEPLRGRPVMLTFDDAYRDFFDTAWPLLRRYDFGAEVFVVTEKVGGCADWDVGDGKPAPLMAWEEIEALRGMGVGFGSHLASHRTADGLSTEELLREGACSRFALEARLQGEIRAIALPFGNHNQRVIRTLRTCGYEIGFTTHDAVASIRMDPMILPRLEIMGTDDLAAFASKIGRHDALRGTRR